MAPNVLRYAIRYVMSSKRLGVIIFCIGFVWCLTLVNISLLGHDSVNADDPEKVKVRSPTLSFEFDNSLLVMKYYKIDLIP